MTRNGAEVIHLATGLVVGYLPCPHIEHFRSFLESRYPIEVVVGTHPIPARYLDAHTGLGTWSEPAWRPLLAATLADAATREAYD